MVKRYASLLWIQASTSLLKAMQYRSDFLLDGLMSIVWLFVNLIPTFILFHQRDAIAGWDLSASLLVIAWFTVLKSILNGAISPSLSDVTDRIRTGSFDYVLLKPVDAQFLCSTGRFSPWKLIDTFGGLAIAIFALVQKDYIPSPAQIALCLVLLIASSLLLYSLWMLIVSASFWVVKLDNLAFLFGAIFDAARWPISIFRGFWRFLFTFILPIAVMTSYPAMALLGDIAPRLVVFTLAGACLAVLLSRLCFLWAIRSYTSASS